MIPHSFELFLAWMRPFAGLDEVACRLVHRVEFADAQVLPWYVDHLVPFPREYATLYLQVYFLNRA